jgi:Domain of unknown function (DUF4249)
MATSCYKIYNPKIDNSEKVLVVNGIMTNKSEAYYIRLSYAGSFNSFGAAEPVMEAVVYVTDDFEKRYPFHEKEAGNYISDSSQFTGNPGRTYRLHILTTDGQEYESDPQRLFPEVDPQSVYSEFDNKETLNLSSGLKVMTHGANILADIGNESDTLPRYRITSDLVIQYYYIVLILLDWDHLIHYDFYCWQTVDANPDLSITGGEYFLNSASIKKYPVCFLDDNPTVFALHYGVRINMKDTNGIKIEQKYQSHEIYHRILYLNQYTLNNATYLYYKSLDEQIKSEGKLFDPIAAQLTGNIKCKTDPLRKAIGFFEASSVSHSAYIVDFRNLKNSQPSLAATPYILPPERIGCRINRFGSRYYNVPSFWISN